MGALQLVNGVINKTPQQKGMKCCLLSSGGQHGRRDMCSELILSAAQLDYMADYDLDYMKIEAALG
jgi:hypothetical protein